MKQKWLAAGLLFVVGVLLFASCGGVRPRRESGPLDGSILLWHAWGETEAQALNQVVDSFTELNPGVSVKVQAFPTEADLLFQFLNSSASGLQADVLLGPASWTDGLIANVAIDPIDLDLSPDLLGRYNPGVLGLVQREGKTYALPQALDTMGLYVNTNLVPTPTNTLAGLEAQANTGVNILLPVNFYDAFWGIQAFGGQLFDAEGRVILDQGGFANWLAWLRDSRNAPGMIQDTNREVLRQRFVAGEAGYYFGYASELNEITSALGRESVAVLQLPSEPVAAAGPFVSAEAIFFGAASSNNQRRLAVALATFITNAEQSARLMRSASLVPANNNVRINPRLNPLVAAFTTQARTAVPVPMQKNFEALLTAGNEAYVRALESGESPAEVAFALTNTVNQARGFEPRDTPGYTCTELGTLVLANTWTQPRDLAGLEQVIEMFQDICPLIIVDLVTLEDTDVAAELGSVRDQRQSPAAALLTQRDLRGVATGDPWLRNIETVIAPETQQKFWPVALNAMRVNGALHGLPLVVDVHALYYNRRLVSAPAQSLDELRSQAAANPIVLDVRLDRAFWGIGAFGGQVFGPDNRAVLDQGGLAQWLAWLVEARNTYGVQLSFDGEEVHRRFTSGETLYYIGGPQELPVLREALGNDLGVALLPTGPGGPARPLVRATGLTFRANARNLSFDLALEFARYATDPAAQRVFLETSSRLPANATLSYDEYPAMMVFAQQAQAGWPAPNTAAWQTVLDLLPEAFEAVIEEGQDPAQAALAVTAAINDANGIAPPVATPGPGESPLTAPATSDQLRENPTPAATLEATPEEGNAP